MRFAIFCHSLRSDWNHGNAHFLRGIVTELQARGHAVAVYEPQDAWSAANLVEEQGTAALDAYRRAYPTLTSIPYDPATLDLARALDGIDLVLVHEWNEPALVAEIGRLRAQGAPWRLLFHDTHHRAVTAPGEMARYDLTHYDGVLAFGETLKRVYEARGWARRVWVWHEAADPNVFRPLPGEANEGDLVWVGNWGDDERTAELHEFLLGPMRRLGLRALVHGVRYPAEARAALEDAGVRYGGWLPNHEAPQAFARHHLTVHVPRRPYAHALPGIPTIRVFEALACGIPLVSAPWDDRENLFTPGHDYLVAHSGEEMERHLRALLDEPSRALELADRGRQTVLSRHTCAHRVSELLSICDSFWGGSPDRQPVAQPASASDPPPSSVAGPGLL